MNGLLRGGIIAAILALVINAIIYLVASSAFFQNELGVSWEVGPPAGSVNLGLVLGITLLAAVVGTLLLFLLSRFTARPVDWFLWIALIFGMASMFGPYQSAANRASIIALGLLHVGAALGIVWGLLYGLRANDFD